MSSTSKGLSIYFTISAVLAFILWMMDTWLLWVVGYIGFGMFLPLAVASWISLVVSRKWADKGKPKPNFMAIYSGVAGSFLLAALTYGIIIYNTDIGTAEERGYSIITLFILVPILFMECLVTTICAVAMKKSKQMPYNYGAYVNPQGNMQGGMPYGNYPNYQGYPNQNYQGGQPNYPNYPNYLNYPNYPNYQGGNAPYGDPRYNNYQGYQGGYPNYDPNRNNFGGQ